MINANKGIIKVYGRKTDLLLDLSSIVKALYEEGEIKKDELEYAFELAFMTNEELDEIDKRLDEELERNKAELKRSLEELFGGREND